MATKSKTYVKMWECSKCGIMNKGRYDPEFGRACYKCGAEDAPGKESKMATKVKGETTKKKATKKVAKKATKKVVKKTAKKVAKKEVVKKSTATNKRSNVSEGQFSDTPGGMIQSLIMEGKLTDDKIFAKVAAKYNYKDNKKRGYVNWCRNYLKKKGLTVPEAIKK